MITHRQVACDRVITAFFCYYFLMKTITRFSLYAGALLSCSFLSGGLVYSGLKHGFGSSDVASWAQAVGSIAAIVAAFFIAKNQADEENQLRAEDQFQDASNLCRAALLLSMEANACLASVTRKLDPSKPAPKNIGTERLEEILFALRNLASKNLSLKVYNEVLVMQCELAYTLTAVRQVNNGSARDAERLRKALIRQRKIAAASTALLDVAKRDYRLPETVLPTDIE